MKIAYIFCSIPRHGRLNGIISQCHSWADSLRVKGHEVVLVTPWENYDWKSFDVIHVFGSTGIWFYNFIKGLLPYNRNIIWSPICDNIDSTQLQYVKSCLGLKRLGLFSLPYMRRQTYKLPIMISVRSRHEEEYISKAYHINRDKFDIVPLAVSNDDTYEEVGVREQFCFHLSTLYQPRKNVLRLVKAAKKYKFNLILAGSMGTDDQFKPIRDEITGSANIKVLGRISESEKINLYKKAKVFALPSVSEGVGIVALDAAHYGCDVVITNVGGPKEYYGDLAWKVNPYSVDEIGQAILEAMTKTHQPALKTHVDKEYSKNSIADKLINSYESLRESSH